MHRPRKMNQLELIDISHKKISRYEREERKVNEFRSVNTRKTRTAIKI